MPEAHNPGRIQMWPDISQGPNPAVDNAWSFAVLLLRRLAYRAAIFVLPLLAGPQACGAEPIPPEIAALIDPALAADPLVVPPAENAYSLFEAAAGPPRQLPKACRSGPQM